MKNINRNPAKAKATRESIKNVRKYAEEVLTDSTSTYQNRVIEKAKNMPMRFRKTYIDAMKGNTRTKALKAFCNECMGFSGDECTSPTCPLFPYK